MVGKPGGSGKDGVILDNAGCCGSENGRCNVNRQAEQNESRHKIELYRQNKEELGIGRACYGRHDNRRRLKELLREKASIVGSLVGGRD